MTEIENKNFMSGKHWIIVLIILISGFGIYTGAKTLNKSKNQKWANESAAILVKQCLTDAKELAEKYPDLTKKYCECSTQKIQAKFTQAEYVEISEMSNEEQIQRLLPTFQDCLTEYQMEIAKLK